MSRGLWDRFWHAEISPAGLALFRILFSYTLWREVATTRAYSRHAIAWDGFTVPYSSLVPLMSEATYEWVHQLQYPLILLLGLGVLTRTSAGALLVLQGWVFFADQLNFRNHPYFFLLVLLLLVFSPAGKALSPGAWWRGRFLGRAHPATCQRLIQVQVTLVYVLAAVHKVHGLYLDGGVIRRLMVLDLPEGDSGVWLRRLFAEGTIDRLFELRWPWVFLATAVVVLEIALPAMLWWRPARRLGIAIGVVFHLSIAFIMNIHVFSYAMIASYLLFLEPETVPGLLRRLDPRAISSAVRSAR